MLKKSALRRIMVSTLALIIAMALYFFPDGQKEFIETNISYVDVLESPIYLLNNEKYVVRTSIVVKNEEPLEKAKELIESLTIEGKKAEYIPNGLKPIIPKNTRILSISLDKKLLKINFSKEFLNIEKSQEEKLIEALVYTLTEDTNISGIMIFVEEQKLERLPQNNILLPNILDRNFGINKVYDITNVKDTTKTTIYYVGKTNDLTYYVPVTKIDNNPKNKIEVIIEELKSSPIYETNLMSYLASNVELLGYEALENQISLSFNNALLSGLNENNISEEVKYSIALSMKDTFQIDDIIIKVDDQIIDISSAI